MKPDFDFVVAGTGAGGAAAAARLAEGGARVAVLEPGPRATPQPDGTRAVALYYANAGLTAGFGNGLFPVAVGRTVGGTTTINSGTCLRPPIDAVARWERTIPGFDAAAFRADVEDVWRTLRVKTVPAERAGASTQLLFRGLERLGVSGAHYLDRAEDGCAGDGRCCFVCPSGAKATAASAFLEPALKTGNVELKAGWRLVEAIPARRGGLAGARVAGPNGERRTLGARGVILACGSLATPYFLRRIGASAGDGLTIHPAAKVFARFDETVEGWRGVPQAGGFLDPEAPRLRFEGAFVPPEMAPLTIPLEGRRLRAWIEAYANVASFGFLVRDAGRGSVLHPVGADMPFIRYTLADEDLRLMTRGMRTVARAYLAAGARKVLLPLNRPDNEIETPRALDAFDWESVRAAELQLMGFHPLGTAGLGRVVGSDLAAAPGVYVCDGSVVPESLGVNPQVTIYAFALGLARRLLGGRA
ncbi:MAG: GMC family oxidoreductase [Elusimicrobia bacterium]|nr:GMC family oxidoreductase [Elusimicrobiota bacterium]